jgi:pyruvate carboxylase subunit B
MGWEVTLGEATHRVEARREGDGWVVVIDGREVVVDATVPQPSVVHIVRDGASHAARVSPTDGGYDVVVGGVRYEVGIVDERRKALAAITGEGGGGGGETISTSMPGKVVAILVAEGDVVEKGQGVIVIEAMKMENELRAGGPGVIASIPVAVGEAVEGGAELVKIAPPEDAS